MDKRSTSMIEKIEQRRLKLIEALDKELESLDAVENRLNVHYQQSVKNVLHLLKDSMDQQGKELIKHSMNEALSLIELMIEKTIRKTQKRLETLEERTVDVHMEMIKEEKQLLLYMQNVNKKLTKIQAKQWIIPTVMGLAIVIALTVGTWGVTQYLSHKILALQELEETIAQTKKTQNMYIKKAWSNAVGVQNKPIVQYSKEEGLWIVYYKEAKE